jgi:hypothetical protein
MIAESFPLWSLLLPILFGAPWIVAIVWFWRQRPRDDEVPLSMAERARQRLWTS